MTLATIVRVVYNVGAFILRQAYGVFPKSEGTMYVATIVRDKRDGRVFVRLGKTAQDGGNVEVVDVLNGSELKELKDRAERFVKDLEQRS